MIQYKTVTKESTWEYVVEKSRFIAHVKPIESKEEADQFITQIKGLHKAATHNVPAMVIGHNFQVQWASDDGEPQGTAGAPIVQMIVKEGITNVAVVITRYFGGIKLGTGGLVRAYTTCARGGIQAAQLCLVEEMSVLQIKIDYTYLSKIQSAATSRQFHITDITYEDTVSLKVVTDIKNREDARDFVINITAGTVEILGEQTELAKKII